MKGGDDIKLNIIQRLEASGFIGDEKGIDIADESKVRVVIENAAVGNSVVVRGRIKGQTNFVNLKTLSGNDNQVVNVFTYDEIQIECTSYVSSSNHIKVLAASFSEAGGSAIDTIGVPSGSDLTDFDSFEFISSDNSVSITGNNITKEIDVKVSPSFGGSYVENFVIADWSLVIDYSLTILQTTHLKGTEPRVQLFEKTGSDHSPVTCDIDIDASGNIVVNVSSSPDLRFDGRIIIF